jgi:hypothetical protein
MRGAMRLTDTDQDTEQYHLGLLSRSSPGRRLGLALSLSATVAGLSRQGIARAHPGSTPEEVNLRFVERSYGSELAQGVRALLRRRAS